MSMYNFGIKASNDPFKNREIISFIESLGYENKIGLDGNLGVDPSPDTVYAAGCNGDNKVHCTVNRHCYAVYDSLEKAKEYLYVPNKEIKITVPEGYEIDEENSTFECIKFKKKQLTYNNIVRELFKKNCFFINYGGTVGYLNDIGVAQSHPNNCTSKRQAEKLLAINKLMNVAKYLNDGWRPNWNDPKEYKFHIKQTDDKLFIDFAMFNGYLAYFKTRELAKQAIGILGEETIKLALCTDY